jgi:hypothetical protein
VSLDKKKRWENFSKEGLPFGVFSGSAMVIISLWFGWYWLADNFENYKITKWQAVECDIITSEVQEGGDSVYKVVYGYKWQNDYFQNNRYQYEWDGKSSLYRYEAVELAEKYKPGDKAVCYVNPDKPNEAVLAKNEPYFLPFIVITGLMVILGGRQLYLGINRFLRGELSEHKNGDIDDVHFEASQSKGISAKIWTYLTWFGLFLAFFLNFPLAILITLFLYTLTADSGKRIKELKYKLIRMELYAEGRNNTSNPVGKTVHFTISERIVLGISIAVYLLIMVFITKHTMGRGYFALVGIVFCALWLGLFMSCVVWMIISNMHGYHYIALQEKKKEIGASKFDLPVWSLLVSNLVVIIWAILDKWPLYMILWVYWGQSLCIGLFLLIRALALKEVVHDLGAPFRKRKKVLKMLGFLFTYILFHCVYVVLIIGLFENVKLEPRLYLGIILAIGIFFVHQIIAFIYDFITGSVKTSIDNLIELAGFRLIPMHLTIMGGGFLVSAAGLSIESPVILLIFLGFKAFADIGMCLQTRKGFSGKMDAIMKQDIAGTYRISEPEKEEFRQDKNGKIKCLCEKINYLDGLTAHNYAKGHLKAKKVIDSGMRIEYFCPFTGKLWLMDFTQEAKANQENYSRLKSIPKKE